MTRVLFLGEEGADLRLDFLAYETAREALSAYELEEPYANTVAVETISIGAAVSLLNDLNWYLVRLVEAAFVLEPSVSEDEWLSRDLATAIRNEEVDPEETGDALKVYGIVEPEQGRPYLEEPMFLRRIAGDVPRYDLHDVDDTLVVRVTDEEFAG